MRKLTPNTDRIIIHLDYDCFYASCVENQHPEYKGKPLAVQQKQIIVTCNYPARERGLRKLQLITEAKHICPELVIVLGEDISLFRDVSKDLLRFVQSFSWNSKVERLGLDEVFLDVSDLIDYNQDLLNCHSLSSSFFHLSKTDPTVGFQFDARITAGEVYDERLWEQNEDESVLRQRLVLGSHLCVYIRQQIESVKGYTCTGGVATNKLLSKLVGNVHKPMSQTTLMPPYGTTNEQHQSVVTSFLDRHEVGKIPGIGFKMAIKLREHAHQRRVEVKDLIMTVSDSDLITVGAFRSLPGMNEAVLERILGGVGAPKGIGAFAWKAMHGVDDQEVSTLRQVPKQISIEDSYLRLDTLENAIKQMIKLTTSLVTRMRLDLTGVIEDDPELDVSVDNQSNLVWLGQPKTIRLSTRPRAPIGRDGVRPRNFTRISRSRQLPSFALNMTEPVEALAERIVAECLLPMFRQLHPQRAGWDLSLVNVAVTDMQEMAGERRMAAGRDISKMFRNQDAVLGAFRVQDEDEDVYVAETMDGNKADVLEQPEPMLEEAQPLGLLPAVGSEDQLPVSQRSRATDVDEWDLGDGEEDEGDYLCNTCGGRMPAFAMAAHVRYHDAT